MTQEHKKKLKEMRDKMLAEIHKILRERMSGYTDSRQPSDDEVTIAWLLCDIQALEDEIKALSWETTI